MRNAGPFGNGKQRSASRQCSTCEYWQVSPSAQIEIGECHKSAPDSLGWSQTRGNEWCGDYAAKGVIRNDALKEVLQLAVALAALVAIIIVSATRFI